MDHAENIATVRDALEEFFSRMSGCPAPDCTVCSRMREKLAKSLAALSALEKIPADAAEILRAARAEAWDDGYQTRKRNAAAESAGIAPFLCRACSRGYVGRCGPEHAEHCRFFRK